MPPKKRNLFAEITEGFDALAKECANPGMSHTHELKYVPSANGVGLVDIPNQQSQAPSTKNPINT